MQSIPASSYSTLAGTDPRIVSVSISSPQGNEILYVLALRMRRRRGEPHRIRRQERVGRVTMVNLNESGTIRLVYLQLVK
jgi:hypothetical protein